MGGICDAVPVAAQKIIEIGGIERRIRIGLKGAAVQIDQPVPVLLQAMKLNSTPR